MHLHYLPSHTSPSVTNLCMQGQHFGGCKRQGSGHCVMTSSASLLSTLTQISSTDQLCMQGKRCADLVERDHAVRAILVHYNLSLSTGH